MLDTSPCTRAEAATHADTDGSSATSARRIGAHRSHMDRGGRRRGARTRGRLDHACVRSGRGGRERRRRSYSEQVPVPVADTASWKLSWPVGVTMVTFTLPLFVGAVKLQSSVGMEQLAGSMIGQLEFGSHTSETGSRVICPDAAFSA